MKKVILAVIILLSFKSFGQVQYGPNVKASTPPQGDESGIVVRQVPQDIDRIGFTKVLSNSIDSDWGTIVTGIGTGMDVDQTGGNLIITTGTTARSETIIRSTNSWLGGIRLRARSTLSSRIVNTNFFVELVDVIGDGLAYTISSATVLVVTFPPGHGFTAENIGQSMYIGAFAGTGTFLSGRYPIAAVSGDNITFTVTAFTAGSGTCSAFGWNYYQLQYTGTTATNVNFDTQRNGWASGVTAATINTTAAPGHLAILTGNDLVATFADQLVASAATIQQTVRANRNENIPDDKNLRLQIRIANGATAPVSSITWTIGLISISHYANTDVSIQDVRPMGVGSAVPVELIRGVATATQPVSGTVTVTQGTAAAAAWLANPLIPVGTVADAGAKTVTVNGTTITNTFAKGVQIIFNVGVVTGTTPTMVCKIQGSTDAGTTWFDIPTAATATLVATGVYGIMIYPSITTVAAVASTGTTAQVNTTLPRTWRAVYTLGGTTPSFTLTNMQYVYLP